MKYIIRHKRRFAAAFLVFIVLWLLAGFELPFDRFEREDYVINLHTEVFGVLFGALITVFFVDRLKTEQDAQNEETRLLRETDNLQRRLVREGGSRSNDMAIAAIDQLRDNGWLTGDAGLLQGEPMLDANLQNVNLESANLEGVNFARADLRDAKLSNANLRWANLNLTKLYWTMLDNADLQHASLSAFMENAVLSESNLRYANFECADLREADLSWTDLRLANLSGADLNGADFEGAKLEGAILPDGTEYTDDTDLERFTNPEHPEFIQTLEKINDIRRRLGYHDLPGPQATPS